MKKDDFFDFYKNLAHLTKVDSDGFFSNETVKKAKNLLQRDYEVFYRQISKEEELVITQDAFHLMLFWVKNNEISIDFFERFLSILVSFSQKIIIPIDENTLPAMIEIMGLVDYKDYAIYTTIKLYVQSPDLMRKQFQVIH